MSAKIQRSVQHLSEPEAAGRAAADGRRDHVAAILDAWRAECPSLDVSPVGIFGRIERLERYKSLALREVYRSHSIDGGEYDILAALRRSGPAYRLTPTELYRASLVTSATMTERLDRLERRGLVQRGRAAHDRRSVLITLTSDGRSVVDQAVADLLAAEETLLRGMTSQDRVALSGLLEKLSVLQEGACEQDRP